MKKYNVAFVNMNGNSESVQLEADGCSVFNDSLVFFNHVGKNDDDSLKPMEPTYAFRNWIHMAEVKEQPAK